jgi:hypothetical protein
VEVEGTVDPGRGFGGGRVERKLNERAIYEGTKNPTLRRGAGNSKARACTWPMQTHPCP